MEKVPSRDRWIGTQGLGSKAQGPALCSRLNLLHDLGGESLHLSLGPFVPSSVQRKFKMHASK